MQTSSLTSAPHELTLPASVKPDAVAEFAARLGISRPLSELLTATPMIFHGPVWVEVDEDPEIENCSYFVFHVLNAGSPQENSRRRKEWYRVSSELLHDHLDKVRLTID
jgi:hypothetical protein